MRHCMIRTLIVGFVALSTGPSLLAQASPITSVVPAFRVATTLPTRVRIEANGFQPGDVAFLIDMCLDLMPLMTTVESPHVLWFDVNHDFIGSYPLRVFRNGDPYGLTVAYGYFFIHSPPPTITGSAPDRFVVGSPDPPPLELTGTALGALKDDCFGTLVAGRLRFDGPSGSREWLAPGYASYRRVDIPPELLALPGMATITVTNLGPGGGSASVQIPIICDRLALAADQPSGVGSLRLRNVCGDGFALYVTAVSFEGANAAAPGAGFWGGLHIAFPDLVQQFASGAPPFVGYLDANGFSNFQVPAGWLPPGLPRAWLVTHTFAPGGVQIADRSPIVSILPN